ncbi:MAG: glucoamylase family protein [Pseudomonadota bacterium]
MLNDQDTELLRSELFSHEQLKRHAIILANQHRLNPRPGPDKLLPRLDDNERVLLMAYDSVTGAVTPRQRIVPAEAWLLDNFYLIEQQISLARRHMPRRYSRQLPQLAEGLSAGFPRIYELALELISHQDGRVDNDNVTNFIAAYQTVTPLKIGELWAFPIMLRLALLENLRRVGLRIARRRSEVEEAIVWAERMLAAAEKEPKQLIYLLAEFTNANVPLTAPFVEEFYAKLQAQGPAMAFAQTWVEHQLQEQGVTATQLLQTAGRKASANQISISNTIGSLRFIGATDWREFVESLSLIEHTLRTDPAGQYASQNFATRDRYRHAIEDIAKNSTRSEFEVAEIAVRLAQAAAAASGDSDRTAHIGYYLIDKGRRDLEDASDCPRRLRARFSHFLRPALLHIYLAPIVLLTTLLSAAALYSLPMATDDWRFIVLAISITIAASSLAMSVVNRLVTLYVPPRTLPRLDFSKGIPDEHRTMVVIPTLLSKLQDVDSLLEALEIRYLGNRDSNLFFALLTDFRDSSEAHEPQDEELLAAAHAGIDALNATYQDDRPCIFYLLHRPRIWNPSERIWMGYERKRGKLEQFNALLRGGDPNVFSDIVGDAAVFPSIKYVITLDTDTQLPRDAARALIGNLAHPLNRPVYDPAKGRVVDGYAILQPRASISLTSASQSRFTRLFAGDAGLDPYTREVSDVYQDIFGEGSFVGKGIYDVDAFRLAVDKRFPDNLILSHDLIEGAYARSALVTDVDLIEEHPASYTMEASRRHRWIRGDWQISGWLWRSVPGPETRLPSPLSALSQWKIFDNLRRSLVAPSLLILLIVGWLSGPAATLVVSVLVTAVLLFPVLFGVLIEYFQKPRERDWLVHLSLTSRAAARPIALAFLTLVLLPYEAIICLDAIVRSGLRMLYTRRGLLLWHTSTYARRNARSTIADFFLEMWVAPVLALLLAATLWFLHSDELVYSAPMLVLWLISPAAGWWISTPLKPPSPNLNAEQRIFLRALARKTWRYFADFVGSQDSWLPPDNFQEHPVPTIASRTSPTNIGLGVLANLSAYDFGYIGMNELLQRTDATLATMEKLERYRGHFYNWYDTRTLQPLRPQYVSSVDSGNLLGCLVTLQAGLAELKHQPILSPRAFKGLQDTLRIVSEQKSRNPDLARKITLLSDMLSTLTLHEGPRTLVAAAALLEEIYRVGGELANTLPHARDDVKPGDGDGELRYWAQAFDQQARALRDDLRAMVQDPQRYSKIPTLAELAAETSTAAPAEAVALPGTPAREWITAIDNLLVRCRELAAMDFEFLYDKSANLLSIGYDVGERRRDPSCYDLLASEARLASFLLIAQEQVPQKHWFALGRLLTSHGGDVSLISWSGSMFEYLMPQLIMPSYENTLLEQTNRAAVARQIEYGRQRGVPWGISESCYNATDMQQTYQYRAFGVPGLGFKRGLGEDLVIAPYASALALMVMPHAACRNLQKLASSGFSGAYGMYEAIDYTPTRMEPGKNHVLVRSFMAHHQGMSLLALEYVLLNQPMQRRFMSDPQVRTTELLLQERVPKKGATLHPHAAEVTAAARPFDAEAGAVMRVFTDPNTPIPEVHLLSNGRYHVMATHAGGGYSRLGNLAITRWREDATSDNWGTYIYLCDRNTDHYWSTAYQPTLRKADYYEAIFVQARAEYRRRDHSIETHTEICVSPEDDVEIRRVTLTNLSSHTRRIEVTSYAEVVLAPLNADLAHRAFSNLFVQTEILPDRQAILCTRRRRTPDEKTPWMFHLIAAPGAVTGTASYETDRAKFIGRGRTPANPAALERSGKQSALSNSAGSVLDPIVAIRNTVTLSPDKSATVQIISGVADTREAALALIEKYCDRHFVERAFEMAWFQSQDVLRHLNVTESDAQIYGRLATSVIYAQAQRRVAPSVIARNRLGQSGLWRFALSGDLPIMLVRIGDQNRIDLVKQTLQAHAYWRMKGLMVDLVILNEDFSGYRAVLHDQIIGLINSGPEAQIMDKPGGVFVRRAEELSEEDRVLFQTVARVVLTDTVETLAEQVDRRIPSEQWDRRALQRADDERRMPEDRLGERRRLLRQWSMEPVPLLAPRDRIFSNGLGGFTPDGREYVIMLEPGQNTPAPWSNVIASPHIGTVVSESGGAYTWVENAHEFRLTPFQNDPLSDTSGEAIYIRDEESGKFWSPSPLPARGLTGYVCRHGFGYSVFEHSEAGIASELHTYVAMDAPVKFAVVKLRNHSGRTRQLSVTGYWELVLGEWRHTNMMHIVTEIDPHTGALFATNAYGREYANRVVFAQVSEPMRTVTGNRTEFIGRNRTLANPAAMHRPRLSGKTGAALDPCSALQAPVELADGQEIEIVFLFGAARDAAEASYFIHRYSGPAAAHQALEAVWGYWNHTLGAVHVETPDPALNVLANGWLIYQTLSCRLWGRSGYYQSGGAYGFRDQLQDTMALIHAQPWLAREQLIRCAGRQFLRGDVQHWWHPPSGQGVRTHFSDDYLWLPYATCRYVLATGDTGVLDEQVHFLEGRELNAEEEAYYDYPQRSADTATLYDHCVRAIRNGLHFGAHQLPLIGCGDWNDGMNLIGRHGKGESVWLAWFLYDNLRQFSDLARSRGDEEFAELCSKQGDQLRRNIEMNAWDGAWYRRAYFDDGTPLGSAGNDECQIDSISQSWAVISGGGTPARARQAMEEVDQRLVRRDARLIQLLDPPFDKSALEPGYIKGYVPGVRENGGQYTHAAIWATMAFAMMGDKDRAWELFGMLNPINRTLQPEEIELYKVEPYVMAADIYGMPPHTGRGGWTWYTGAAGWMYRLTMETLLGVQLEVDHIRITPCVPDHWDTYKIHYRFRSTFFHITARRAGEKNGRISVWLDGVALPETAQRETTGSTTALPTALIPLVDDQRNHEVLIEFS